MLVLAVLSLFAKGVFLLRVLCDFDGLGGQSGAYTKRYRHRSTAVEMRPHLSVLLGMYWWGSPHPDMLVHCYWYVADRVLLPGCVR